MTFSLNRLWLSGFMLAATTVFAFKCWLAFTTNGAADITVWKDFLFHVKQCGVCVYQTGGMMQYPGGTRLNPFNHPPFIIHFLRFVDLVCSLTGLRFETALRVITSSVDLGSAIVVYQLMKRDGVFQPWLFLLYILAPATIIISGYHGNTDTLMIFFVLLAALLIHRPVLAGSVFGIALSIKAVPIIFIPVFLLYLNRSRRWFVATAISIVLVLSLPFIFQTPIIVLRAVLGYGGFPGRWGWTQALFATIGPGDLFRLIARLGAYLLLGVVAILAIRMNRIAKPPIYFQLGFTAFFFLAFTPAWGTNYLPWLDPFPVILGFGPSLLYYISSGALLSYLYFIRDDESTRLMGICWITILIVTWAFIRKLKDLEKTKLQAMGESTKLMTPASKRSPESLS